MTSLPWGRRHNRVERPSNAPGKKTTQMVTYRILTELVTNTGLESVGTRIATWLCEVWQQILSTEGVMLEQAASICDGSKEQTDDRSGKVKCFVCKKDVDQGSAKKVRHAKEKNVWVCETHIK